MSSNSASVPAGEQAEAQFQATLRFAAAVTAAFIACEFLQWTPTFLAPVLVAALLGNLPMRLPLKLGVVLIVTMAAASLFAFVLASLLRGTPAVLVGLIGLSMFLAFYAMARGRPAFPLLLLLICLLVVPVMVMVAPAQAGAVPKGLTRGIATAVVIIWVFYLPWPRKPPPKPAAAATAEGPASPEVRALLSTAVLLPLVLVYLLFGLSDVIPVLMGALMLVVNFDLRSSGLQALGMILGNLAGGLFGLVLYAVLRTTPSLTFMALLLFPALLLLGRRIVAGGPYAPAILIACNAMLIIFSSAIADPSPLSLWLARVFQFVLAGAFAVGMMHLTWHRAFFPSSASKPADRSRTP